MSMNAVQQNLSTTMQEVANELLALKNRLAIIGAMYASEAMASLTDADYQLYAPFEHVTAAEMNAARTAMGEINTAMGEYIAGSAATRLMRIVARVP